MTNDVASPYSRGGGLFTGRRGRLLIALLLAELAAAVQGIAYSTVLPLAAAELHGDRLYGATLTAGSFATIAVLATGTGVTGRFSAGRLLLGSTGLYLVGVIVAATAPVMALVLTGSVLRGLAGGLLAGFGLSAIGGLFDAVERPRVLGLFAAVWVLPSLLGPLANSAVATQLGWRAALAWPAVLIVGARLLIGRDVRLIPWRRSTERADLGTAVLLLTGLVLAAAAPGLPRGPGIAAFAAGLLLSAGAAAVVLNRVAAGNRIVQRTLLAFGGLCLVFFGGDGLLAPAIITGLGRSVATAGWCVSAGLLGWALVGMRPGRVDDAIGDTATLGCALIAVGSAALAVSPLRSNSAALTVALIGWTVAGIGMGLAYPRLMSAAFDRAGPERTTAIATGVAFAELAGSAIGTMLTGGSYSLLQTVTTTAPAGAAPCTPFVVGFGAVALAAAATTVITRISRPGPSRPSDPKPPDPRLSDPTPRDDGARAEDRG